MNHKTYIYSIFLPRIEVFYIEEWAKHHFQLGVKKIYLYHNGYTPFDQSRIGNNHPTKLEENETHKWQKKPLEDYNTDLTDEEIDKKLEEIEEKFEGRLHIKYWGTDIAGDYPGSQFRGYKELRGKLQKFQKIQRFPHHYPTHWLIIDIDEFLVLHKDKNLQSFLEKRKEWGAIQIKSRIFESRTNKKQVKSIFNWGYDTSVCKTIVINRGTPRITAHRSKSRYNENVTEAQRQFAEIFHYRGPPFSGAAIFDGFPDQKLAKKMIRLGPTPSIRKKLKEIFSKKDFTMRRFMNR